MANLIKKHRDELLIFLVLFLCYSYFLPRWADWSQNSRLDLVLAIVDDRTLSIDKYYQNTGDYFCFNKETGKGGCNEGGPHFSDKAPGVALLGVPIYAATKPILQSALVETLMDRLAHSAAFGETLDEERGVPGRVKVYQAVVLYLVTIGVVALPSAILGVLLYRFLSIFGRGRTWRIVAALLYGLGTTAFPYSGALYSHQVTAFLLFGAFYLAFCIGRKRIPEYVIALVGLMLGLAVISEYPTALIAVAVFGYAVVMLPNRRWIVGLVVGGIVPGLILMAYDWIILGNILPLGYQYSELWKDDVHAQGFLSLVGPNLEAIWGISFGTYRGLFFMTPVLLLALVGFVIWWRQKTFRLEWGASVWSVTALFLFNGSSVMWQGGYSIGPRYLVPMLPFLALGLGVFIERIRGDRWLRLILIALALWSVAAVWVETIGGQQFPDYTPNPLTRYSLPRFTSGDMARNLGMSLGLSGFPSLLPLSIAFLGIGSLFWYANRRWEGIDGDIEEV